MQQLRPARRLSAAPSLVILTGVLLTLVAIMAVRSGILAAQGADTTPPDSSITALPGVTYVPTIELSWSATDDESGVASYDVWYRVDGGPSTVLLEDTTLTETTFIGEVGHSYFFRVRATDNDGNVEPLAEAATTRTEVRQLSLFPAAYDKWCIGFCDDFSNPRSGWFEGEESWFRAGYRPDLEVYSILLRPAFELLGAGHEATYSNNFDVSVDARHAQGDGLYGLFFGYTADHAYFFYQDQGYYRLLYLDQNLNVLVDWTPLPGLGQGWDTFRVVRDGDLIRIFAEGQELRTVHHPARGPGNMFLIALSISDNYEALYDNFSLVDLDDLRPASGQTDERPAGAADRALDLSEIPGSAGRLVELLARER